MKANEAPEKIYLVEDRQKHIPMEYWYNSTTDDSKIEYIRTDAFIEKAVEFFGDHLCEYIDVKNANCDTFINIDGDKLKEDFEEYLKK